VGGKTAVEEEPVSMREDEKKKNVFAGNKMLE
jgi:hypothetical protein